MARFGSGASLLPLVARQGNPVDLDLTPFYESDTIQEALLWANGEQLAVRRGYWKLVMNGITYGRSDADKKPLTGDDALFLSNLKDDPGETRNLRHQHPELVDELSSLAQKS